MLRKLRDRFFSMLQAGREGGEDYPYPKIDETAWVAPDAVIIGDVEIGENSSIWPGTVLRGDIGKITIGKNTNIQDNVVIHPNSSKGVVIGDNVTVAHGTVLDGCNVGSNVMIGINVTALHHAFIKDNIIVGAGSLLPPGTSTDPESVYSGNPVEKVRDLTEDDRRVLDKMSEIYVRLKGEYEY